MERLSSRERLIQTTAQLLQEKGYYGTGLKDILKLSGTPSGSLYHYFPDGKEELTAAAIRSAGRRLENKSKLPLKIIPIFIGLCKKLRVVFLRSNRLRLPKRLSHCNCGFGNRSRKRSNPKSLFEHISQMAKFIEHFSAKIGNERRSGETRLDSSFGSDRRGFGIMSCSP